MNHTDHVNLISRGVSIRGGVWADLGSGQGAFTLALAELIGTDGIIYSVDRDGGALREQERLMKKQFPHQTVHYRQSDISHALDLPPLDGIVIANALHFFRDKAPILQQIRAYLKLSGRLIVVEYDTDSGNMWVPYPFSYTRWQKLAEDAGFVKTKQIATHPSRFLGAFYAAMSMKTVQP